jgi:hypothetical protein
MNEEAFAGRRNIEPTKDHPGFAAAIAKCSAIQATPGEAVTSCEQRLYERT